MAWGSCQSFFDAYDLSSNDEEYLTSNNVGEMTPGRSHCAARQLTTAWRCLNSPPEPLKNWGHIYPNLNDYHSDPIEISSTFWLPDITDLSHRPEKMHSKYADLCDVASDIFSVIPHGVRVEPSISISRDVIGWRPSKATCGTLCERVVVRQCGRANNGNFAGAVTELDASNTENNSEVKQEPEQTKLHRMAKVHDLLEMRQGSQNLRATQKESRTGHKQMPTVGYISDTEEIIKALWQLFQHDGAAAFELSERYSLLPPVSAKDLPGC